MSDQNSNSVETLVAPAASYRSVNSAFHATTGDVPQMTFVWSAAVVAGEQAAIDIEIRCGGGLETDNVQKVQIPWGWTGPISLPDVSNRLVYATGSVSAAYSTDGSVVIILIGSMIYPGVNHISCNGGTVAACLAIG